jgi:beta-catenin-like protein 1
VDLFGLKSLFGAFKRKKFGKFKKTYPQFVPKVLDENCISIIYSLFLNLEEPELTRLLFKFIESDFESLHHLVILHVEYSSRVAELPDLDYLDRLDRGLLALQLIDAVMLQGCFKSEEIGVRVPGLLSGFNMSLKDVIGNVEEYHDNLEDEGEARMVKASVDYAKELDKLAFKKPA